MDFFDYIEPSGLHTPEKRPALTPRVMRGKRVNIYADPENRQNKIDEGVVQKVGLARDYGDYWLVQCRIRRDGTQRVTVHTIRSDK